MALHKITILALLSLGVLVSGCCCCTNYVPGGISVPPTIYPGTIDLVGTWSSEGSYGTLYDPATGSATGSVYNGEWYLFRSDGTYRYVIMGSGVALSGGIVREGRYSLDGSEIVFRNIVESWYPDASRSDQEPAYKDRTVADERLSYEELDTDTISIDGYSFYRVTQ
jgi:hypothetical protein